MNSFNVFAIGNLAAEPECGTKGEVSFTRFRLIGNDYGGRDEQGQAREIITSVWFIAFGPLGDAIAKHCHVGDQLIVEARIRQNNWTDKNGQKRYGHSYQVEGFRFGRQGRTSRGKQPETGPSPDGDAMSDNLDDDDIPF